MKITRDFYKYNHHYLEKNKMNEFYTYIYLDPRKSGNFVYNEELTFDYKPFYIGKGKGRRFRKHILESKKKNNMNNAHKFAILQKILAEGLEPIIIKINENLSEEESINYEKEYIKLIGRSDKKEGPLTNQTDGGEGISGYKFSDATKLIMGEKATGRKHTEEHKRYMSTLMSGRKLSDETKQKISKSKKGFIHTDETKKLWSDQRKGENHPNFNKHLSEETKSKIGKGNTGKIKSKETRKAISKRMTGLLIGDKNPMYGKTGAQNPNAKTFIITTDIGEKFIVTGLTDFCRDMNFTK